ARAAVLDLADEALVVSPGRHENGDATMDECVAGDLADRSEKLLQLPFGNSGAARLRLHVRTRGCDVDGPAGPARPAVKCEGSTRCPAGWYVAVARGCRSLFDHCGMRRSGVGDDRIREGFGVVGTEHPQR